MTQENAKLIAQELGSRLSYGVKIRVNDKIETVETVEGINILDNIVEFGTYMACDIDEIKPYLFPLSNMTEEQYDEMEKIVSDDYLENIQITKEMREKVDFITHFPIYCPNVIDWFNKNHFDYRGLIEKGLALDATGLGIY